MAPLSVYMGTIMEKGCEGGRGDCNTFGKSLGQLKLGEERLYCISLHLG